MQTAGGEHDFIDEAGSPVAEDVSHDVATFDPGDGVLHRDPHAADDLVDRFLDGMEFTATRFLLGLERLGVRRFVALEAGVFDHQGVGWKDQSAFIRQLFVVHAAGAGGSEVNDTLLAGEQQVLLAVRLPSCRCSFSSGRPGSWADARAVPCRRAPRAATPALL